MQQMILFRSSAERIQIFNRLSYSLLSGISLPIDCDAMESAICRVVNLCLKGPDIFLKKETAEAILLLRAYYKAGRWNLLKNMASSTLLMESV